MCEMSREAAKRGADGGQGFKIPVKIRSKFQAGREYRQQRTGCSSRVA